MMNFGEFWAGLGYNRYFLIGVAILFGCHLIYLIYRSVVVLSKRNVPASSREQGVSVIITSNNKVEFLRKNLEAFLTQDYQNYEVIVVDECSEDETQDFLAEMQQKYPQLRTTRIFPDTKFRNTKKIAINIGILAAKYDILLFSEITCVPETKNWVKTMQSYFDQNTAVVLGFANYKAGKESNRICRYFRFLRFLRMMLLIRNGMYVIGDGYNMAYRKSYYMEKRGFSKNSQIYLGYDSEMVKELSKKGEVKVVKDVEARIVMEDSRKKVSQEDCMYYYAIKRTWPLGIQLRVNVDFIVLFFLYTVSGYLILTGVLYKYMGMLMLLTFLMDFIVINVYLKHLSQKKLFLTSFIVSIFGLFYKWYFNMYSIFTSKKWR